jgi:hypothetical protein
MFSYSSFVSDLPRNRTLLLPAPPFLGDIGEKVGEKEESQAVAAAVFFVSIQAMFSTWLQQNTARCKLRAGFGKALCSFPRRKA